MGFHLTRYSTPLEARRTPRIEEILKYECLAFILDNTHFSRFCIAFYTALIVQEFDLFYADCFPSRDMAKTYLPLHQGFYVKNIFNLMSADSYWINMFLILSRIFVLLSFYIEHHRHLFFSLTYFPHTGKMCFTKALFIWLKDDGHWRLTRQISQHFRIFWQEKGDVIWIKKKRIQ